MKRHHGVVRVTHWINVVALAVMAGSGLRIFNAYPRFAPRGGSFCCYPFEGAAIPEWLTFGGWLAGARNWHFAMMWVLVINGLVYLGWVYLRGEWRDLVPRRGDPRDAWLMIRFYLGFTDRHPPQGKHNALQKASYFAVPLIAMVAVVSGIAIWKPVSLGWLADLLGGYVWARYWHFLAMLALVAFTVVHTIMVVAVDPYSMRAMITGRYDESRSPVARNARPFRNLRGAAPERTPDGDGGETDPDTARMDARATAGGAEPPGSTEAGPTGSEPTGPAIEEPEERS
jgi:Ni/Fe-hydrogenase b-type cytochrome subunit